MNSHRAVASELCCMATSARRVAASSLYAAVCSTLLALSPGVLHAQTSTITTPTAPATSPGAEPPLFRPYVILKPEFIAASAAVESFGQPNASAPSAAGNPVLATLPKESFTTFQAAQSRLGFWFDEKGPARGHLEFDFIDFTKSSPTVASVPRLRIANVDWVVSDHFTISAGQDWDLYAPINPYTLNITASGFQTGNSGFMRQQAKFIYHNDAVELGAALGMSGVNNTAKLGVPEFGRLPSLAVRAALLFGSAGRIGVSALGARWRFGAGTAAERYATAGAVNLYGDVTPFAHFSLRFEGYAGRDLANIGSLTLSNGNLTDDINEIGGFVSAKYNLTDTHALYTLLGTAKVLNDGKVVPAYSYPATTDGMIPAASAATIAGTGPGMIANTTLRLGYEYRYSKSLAVQLEGFMFHSHHVLQTVDVDRFDPVRSAYGAELGLFYTL